MFMRTYASSRVKRKSFYRKSELQMFLLISGVHIGAPFWRLHTKLHKGARNVSANNSETVFSRLLLADCFQFIFLLRDNENDLYT